MTKEEFVNNIQIIAIKNVSKSLVDSYQNPPGRKPSEDLLAISTWFNKLSQTDKNMVLKVINNATKLSTFSVLSVLDGVSAIESTYDKGKLELWYKKDSKEVLLNSEEGDYLHDLMD